MARTVNRRQFLIRGGLVAGAVATVGGGVAAKELSAESTPDLADWDDVRAEFALDPDVVQMTAFLLAPHPRRVREAIERHRSGLDANPKAYLFEHERRLEEAVAAEAADYLGASPDQVALTDSTTMGLALVYSTLQLRDGDEILTSEHDHYATHESLRLRAARTPGVSVRKVSLYRPGSATSADEIVERLRAAIGPRTRLVALTWVHSSTGVKLPIRSIAEMLAGVDGDRPTLFAVDGVHALGVERARVSELGCDYFVAGCHKWLFGPRGTGLVWARPEAWTHVAPVSAAGAHDDSRRLPLLRTPLGACGGLLLPPRCRLAPDRRADARARRTTQGGARGHPAREADHPASKRALRGDRLLRGGWSVRARDRRPARRVGSGRERDALRDRVRADGPVHRQLPRRRRRGPPHASRSFL